MWAVQYSPALLSASGIVVYMTAMPEVVVLHNTRSFQVLLTLYCTLLTITASQQVYRPSSSAKTFLMVRLSPACIP